MIQQNLVQKAPWNYQCKAFNETLLAMQKKKSEKCDSLGETTIKENRNNKGGEISKKSP